MADIRVLQLPALRRRRRARHGRDRRGLGPSVARCSSGGPLQISCGLHLHWPTLRWRDPLSVLFINPLLLIYAVNRHGISIVHARSRCLALSARIALLFAPGVRLVATWHGFHTSTSWWRRAFNGLLLGADCSSCRASACAATCAPYPRAPTDGWTTCCAAPRRSTCAAAAAAVTAAVIATAARRAPPRPRVAEQGPGPSWRRRAAARRRRGGRRPGRRRREQRPGRYHRALAASAAAAGNVRLLPPSKPPTSAPPTPPPTSW